MVVGQLLPVTRNCLKVTTALKMIDPQTGLGPLTAETIAGTQDLYMHQGVPSSRMKLSGK